MSRVLSAAVLIGLVAGTLWYLPFWATGVLAAVAAALAGAEIAKLAARAGAHTPVVFVAVASAALTLAFVIYDPRVPGSDDDSLGAVLLVLLVVSGTIALVLGPPTPSTLTAAAVMIMGPIYVGLPLGAVVWVQWAAGAKATTWLIAVVAVSDSAQYYVGRSIGRTKLAPAISPAKTNEGAIGGVIAAVIAGTALGSYCLPGLPRVAVAAVAFVVAIFGIAGDLFESLLKRSAGAKDASALIPGHGGILDRIDAYLFAAPVFYLLLRYVA